jgi:hypothetical protein
VSVRSASSRAVVRRVCVAIVCVSGLLVTSGIGSATVTAQQRVDAAATVTFVASGDRSWIVDLYVSGPGTGVPSSPGEVTVDLRSCVSSRCSPPVSYVHPLQSGQYTADQKASSVSVHTILFGRPMVLNWQTSSDYQVSPTLVLYNHFVTGGGQAAVLIPAVRDASAAGTVLGHGCTASNAETAIETDIGNIPSDVTPAAPSRLPARFGALAHARCR